MVALEDINKGHLLLKEKPVIIYNKSDLSKNFNDIGHQIKQLSLE